MDEFYFKKRLKKKKRKVFELFLGFILERFCYLENFKFITIFFGGDLLRIK